MKYLFATPQHRISFIFFGVLLVLFLLLVPFAVSAGDGGGSGSSGASDMGGDFMGDPPAGNPEPSCSMGWAYDPNSNTCVVTGNCEPYYYWNGPASGCQVCSNDVSTQYQTLSCPLGQTGSISQYRTSYCPSPYSAPTWPAWTTSSNSCANIQPPTITANPTTVHVGDPSTITWSCGAGDTSSAGSNFSTNGATSGSVQVNPITTMIYAILCSPSSQSTSVAVTVQNPVLTISASPSRVRSGSSSVLSWSASGVSSCTLKNGAATLASCASSGACASAHTVSTGPLTTQSMFKLTCGTATANTMVYITPRVCEVGTANCPN